jgi:hypothetical protein
MSQHTPAPWTFEPRLEYENGHCLGIFGPNGEEIVVTDSGYYPPKLADAHLIAAAPELLEACQWVEAAFRDYSLDHGGRNAIARVKAVIAKAEGRK